MGLAEYCAYFFVSRRLGSFVDRTPPVDAPLPAGIEHRELAAELAVAVNDAAPVVHPDVLHVDAAALAAAAGGWQTVFEARDSLIACSLFDPSQPPDDKKIKSAFADYIAMRWIFKEVFKFEIRRRPIDRAFPPPFDADAKAGLAESLVTIATSIGLSIKDRDAFVQGAPKWETLGAAVAALMKQVAL